MIDYDRLAIDLGRVRYLKRPGDSVEGVVLGLDTVQSRYDDDRQVALLRLDVVPDGIIISGTLFDALLQHNVQDGERWRVTRGDALPGSQGKPGRVQWHLQQLDSIPAAPVPGTFQQQERPAPAPALRRPSIPAW